MPNLEIISSSNPSLDMDVKRFYMPGVTFKSNCPHCGELQSKDMERHYLSYPKMNSPLQVHFYHETEEDAQGRSESHEWSETIILSIAISEVK